MLLMNAKTLQVSHKEPNTVRRTELLEFLALTLGERFNNLLLLFIFFISKLEPGIRCDLRSIALRCIIPSHCYRHSTHWS